MKMKDSLTGSDSKHTETNTNDTDTQTHTHIHTHTQPYTEEHIYMISSMVKALEKAKFDKIGQVRYSHILTYTYTYTYIQYMYT